MLTHRLVETYKVAQPCLSPRKSLGLAEAKGTSALLSDEAILDAWTSPGPTVAPFWKEQEGTTRERVPQSWEDIQIRKETEDL